MLSILMLTAITLSAQNSSNSQTRQASDSSSKQSNIQHTQQIPVEKSTISDQDEKRDNKLVEIDGTVAGDTKGYNWIYYYNDQNKDSTLIRNGKFKLEIPFSGATTVLFYTEYEAKTTGMIGPYPIFFDTPAKIHIIMNIMDGFIKSIFSGIRSTIIYDQYTKESQEFINGYFRIADSLKKVQESETGKMHNQAYHDKIRDSVLAAYSTAFVGNFIKKYPDEFVSLYILNEQKIQLKENTGSIFHLLSKKQQQSKLGKDVLSYVKSLNEAVLEGDKVLDFSLSDAEGNNFNFSSLKGKYVWIDFWASWCRPCRTAFPYMHKIMDSYSGKNFIILGISVDVSRENWMKAIKEDKNPWPQVLDTKAISAKFSVTAYPTGILVDPEGNILVKEIGFTPGGASVIEKRLKKIFKSD